MIALHTRWTILVPDVAASSGLYTVCWGIFGQCFKYSFIAEQGTGGGQGGVDEVGTEKRVTSYMVSMFFHFQFDFRQMATYKKWKSSESKK